MNTKIDKFFKTQEQKPNVRIGNRGIKFKKHEKSKINWTDHAWNPWVGCRKLSEACRNCYIDRVLKEKSRTVKRTTNKTWRKPYEIEEPSLIFVCNYSDFFIEDADDWRDDAWKIINENQHHFFLILTKRPERIKACLPKNWGKNGYDNVFLGVTVEDSTKKVLKRLDDLREIPAKIRFVSVEPIYKEFNFTKAQVEGFDWFILGGETDFKNARDCKVEWIHRLAIKLLFYKKAVFIKQLGTVQAKKLGYKSWHGEDWDEFDAYLRIRQFPIAREPRNIKPKSK